MFVNFKDGAVYHFDVKFGTDPGDTITGLSLFDAIEAETTLTTDRLDFGPFGIFIDGIDFDGHANAGYLGGEDWWHYWNRDGSGPWVFGSTSASFRLLGDGDADGWVYGSAAAPVPEPASLGLLGIASLAVLRRRR